MSRRFVAATQSALTDMLAADLSGLDLVARSCRKSPAGSSTNCRRRATATWRRQR